MFDVKISDFKLDEKTTTKFISLFRDMWFGIPKWLRNLLVITVAAGAVYFLYNRVMISYDIDELQREVKELNDMRESSVFYDRYSYDVQRVTSTINVIETQLDELYNTQTELIILYERAIKKVDPNSPVLDEIRVLKRKRELAKESYERIIEHNIQQYNNGSEYGAQHSSHNK